MRQLPHEKLEEYRAARTLASLCHRIAEARSAAAAPARSRSADRLQEWSAIVPVAIVRGRVEVTRTDAIWMFRVARSHAAEIMTMLERMRGSDPRQRANIAAALEVAERTVGALDRRLRKLERRRGGGAE
jgi:hypothetical protein